MSFTCFFKTLDYLTPKPGLRAAVVAAVFCTGTPSFAADLLFAIPDRMDPPTAQFVDALLIDDRLAEAGFKLDVRPYAELGGARDVVSEMFKSEAVALLSTDLLTFVARNEEQGAVVDMLSAYERSYFGVPPNSDATDQRRPLEVGATALLGEMGLYGLANWPSSPSSVFASNAETNVADLQGLKLRTVGTLSAEIFEQLGAVPQSLPFSEVYQSLQAGAIDAAEVLSVPDGALSRFYEASPNGALFLDAKARTGFFVIGKPGVDALTARQLKTLESAAQNASLVARETLIGTYNATLREAEENGVRVASLSAAVPEDYSLAQEIAQAYGLSTEEIRDLVGDIDSPVAQAAPGPAPDSRQGDGRAPEIFVATSRNDEFDSDLRLRFGYKMDADSPLHCFKLIYARDANRRFGDPYTGAVEIGPSGVSAGPADCAQRIFDQQDPGQRLTILIHGFNNSFEDAVNWAVAVTEDLAIDGDVLLWSWPSMGQLSAYVHDRDSVDFNSFYLEPFLASLKLRAEAGKAQDMSILAHSMGGLVAINALRFLAKPPQMTISNVALVAPDVRHAVFKKTLQQGAGVSPLWSVYANSNDVALLASYGVNRNPSIGLGGRHRLMVAGVETVDVSALDRDVCIFWKLTEARCRNHTHAFDVQPVANDLAKLLATRDKATARGLAEKQVGPDQLYYEIAP